LCTFKISSIGVPKFTFIFKGASLERGMLGGYSLHGLAVDLKLAIGAKRSMKERFGIPGKVL
jgi:hypothetical protein